MNKNMEIHPDSNTIVGIVAVFFGGFVGAIKKVSNTGWKGWLWFFSSMTLNVFVGLVAYLLALQTHLTGLYPIIIALVFGFVGEKGGDVIMNMVIDYLKIKYGQTK